MTFVYTLCVVPYQRIRELSAQLLRSTDPLVIQIVADQLKTAIDAYVAGVQNDFPAIELLPGPEKTAA